MRISPLSLLALALGGCASGPHINAYQQATLSAPRTLVLAIEADEDLPFGIERGDVIRVAEQAGFIVGPSGAAHYRLFLAAASSSAGAQSFLPASRGDRPPEWVARADRSWRARAMRRDLTRVTAVLFDTSSNREVWRGTATRRGNNGAGVAKELAAELLARLPGG